MFNNIHKRFNLYIFTTIALVLLVVSCKKETNFVNENTLGRGIAYYPLSLNTLRDTVTKKLFTDTSFSANQAIAFELQYYSQDTVQEVDLYATVPGTQKQLVKSWPFQLSYYSRLKGWDTTILSYTIPTTVKTGDIVRLDAVVLNTNSLSVTRSILLNIQ